jgi:LacI family transcriptional regulator
MNSGDTPITLRQIAAKAGLSASAVSLALRGHASIPETTRQHVEAVAKGLGWTPNPLVSAAMSHRRGSRTQQELGKIALVTAWERPEAWRLAPVRKGIEPALLRPRMSEQLITGMQQRALERGFEVEEFWVGTGGLTETRLGQILVQRGLQGVIVAPVPVTRRALSLPWEHFAAATVGYSLASPLLDTVTTHHLLGMELLLRRVKAAGYARPMLILQRGEHERVQGLWSTAFSGMAPDLFSKLPASLAKPYIFDLAADLDALPQHLSKAKPDVLLSCPVEDVQAALSGTRWENTPLLTLYVHRESHGRYAGLRSRELELGGECLDVVVNRILMNRRGLPELRKITLLEPVWQPGASFPE